jgi:hypothetical protein
MDDPDDVVVGTLAGFNLTRHSTPIGRATGIDSVIVRLGDGREVTAILDLPKPKHSFMITSAMQIGYSLRVRLGTVREPIRVIEVLKPPA